MKKILYFITLSEIGGAQKVVYQLIQGFYQNYEIFLACAHGGELINWVEKLDLSIKIIPLPKLKRSISIVNDLIVFFQLIRVIRENSIDIIHCHSSKAGIIGRLAAWLTGVPVRIFTVHGWSSYSSKNKIIELFYNTLEKLIGLISTHIVCVSESDRKYALKQGLASKRKLYIIHNGVTVNETKPSLREELGINQNKIIIGTVARLSYQKDPLYTIDVYSKLLLEDENLIFIWIGDGPLREECFKKIRKENLENRFILLGSRDDAINLIGDFNIFSLLSRWESLPISIIEAMFAGLPILAADVGGVKELVEEGKNGILVNNEDINNIREKIIKLIYNKDLMLEYGEYSKKIAYEKFTESVMIKKYSKIYDL